MKPWTKIISVRKSVLTAKVLDASWDSEAALWTLTVENSDTGDVKTYQCNFLWMCQGYYRHSAGYMPDYPGRDVFKGPVIHPQTWPEKSGL